jgi:hypothetical protein
MRMLLGPSYFAKGHIRVGGSVYVPHKQLEGFWSLCICSVRDILIEVLDLLSISET